MNDKPIHYDGSSVLPSNSSGGEIKPPFKLTDDTRKVISGNPFHQQK
ncbi:hypothetical protein [Alkalihalobacillus sp. CinArs1]|nr:hypothetical protein [Alkalihalobacillus sp. CinArs1]